MSNSIARRFRYHALLIACGLAVACTSPASAREPVAGKLHRFESEIAAFEKWDRQNAFPKDGILFVGSSSVRLWQTAESFSDLPVINRGFGGSSISDVNNFFDRLVPKYKPRVIVFYSGDNDIAGGMSAQKTFEDFQRFVHSAHEQVPEARILVLSIKPSIARRKLWPEMKRANSLIAKLADDDPHLDYVDIAAPMLNPAGEPRKELFRDDGLHLNAAGYDLWDGVLGPYLRNANKQ